MQVLKTIFARHRTLVAALIVMITGLVFIAAFGRQTFGLPLLGDHCMKTSKSIEVAYNMVRYGDFLHEYDDWQAKPKNPRGAQGSIFRYESPLSAIGLGTVYLAVNGKNFNTRIAAARIFTLLHLAAAYLIIAAYIFRKDLFSLLVFSFLFIGSAFTVSYSTKPLPETYALFYQALLLAVSIHLLGSAAGSIKKSLILAGLTALLCLCGKMNYFFIAFPVIVGYPFLDRHIKGMKSVLKYFTLFAFAGALGVLVLLLFTEFSFHNAFVYMIRGNKPILNDSLWQTFVEGFDALDVIIKRTRTDFGPIVFDWGQYSFLYLGAKFIYCLTVNRKRELSLFEKFSSVLLLLVLGHALNYVVLRNLFIPHRYYVVPIFIIFCLSITVLVADFRTLLLLNFPLKQKVTSFLSFLLSRFRGIFAKIKGVAETYAASRLLAVFFFTAAVVAWYFADTLSYHGFRTTAILALKALGNSNLAIEIGGEVEAAARVLMAVAVACLVGAVLSASAGVLAGRIRGIQRLSMRLASPIKRSRITALHIVVCISLLIPSGFIVFQNARSFYDYAASHVELIENAGQLAAIRNDTISGDMVLCWKPCFAFYTDKRSILTPEQSDVPYYQENNIHSVLGPVKPFYKYYKRIEKYPPPMSYWAPKTAKDDSGDRKSSQQKMKNKDQ